MGNWDSGKLTENHKEKSACLRLPRLQLTNKGLNPVRPACLYLSPFIQTPVTLRSLPHSILQYLQTATDSDVWPSVQQKRHRTHTKQQSPSLRVWTGQKKKEKEKADDFPYCQSQFQWSRCLLPHDWQRGQHSESAGLLSKHDSSACSSASNPGKADFPPRRQRRAQASLAFHLL